MYNKDEPRPMPGIGQILTSDRGGRKRQVWLNTANTRESWAYGVERSLTPVGEPGSGLWFLDHLSWLAMSALPTNLILGLGTLLPLYLHALLTLTWAIAILAVCWAAWKVAPGPLALMRTVVLCLGLVLGGHLWII